MADSNWGDFLGDTLGTSQTTEEPTTAAEADSSSAPNPLQTDPAELTEDTPPAPEEDTPPAADGTTEPASTEPASAEPAPTEPAPIEPTAEPASAEAATWEAWAQHDMAEAAVLNEVAAEHLEAASEWAAYGNIEEAREELAQAEVAAEMAEMEGRMASMEERMAEAVSEPSWDSFGTAGADAGQAETWSGQEATHAASNTQDQDNQFEPQPEPEPEPDYGSGSDERELQDGEPF